MSILNSPKTKTLRDGQIVELSSEELVLDDIVIFEAGCQIPADAVVVEGEISVNESLITGEADEIVKNPGKNFCREALLFQDRRKPDSAVWDVIHMFQSLL